MKKAWTTLKKQIRASHLLHNSEESGVSEVSPMLSATQRPRRRFSTPLTDMMMHVRGYHTPLIVELRRITGNRCHAVEGVHLWGCSSECKF